jgi:hypothetical protein
MRVLGAEHRVSLLAASGLIVGAPVAVALGLLALWLGW